MEREKEKQPGKTGRRKQETQRTQRKAEIRKEKP